MVVMNGKSVSVTCCIWLIKTSDPVKTTLLTPEISI
jgi:hypothetical protein